MRFRPTHIHDEGISVFLEAHGFSNAVANLRQSKSFRTELYL